MELRQTSPCPADGVVLSGGREGGRREGEREESKKEEGNKGEALPELNGECYFLTVTRLFYKCNSAI